MTSLIHCLTVDCADPYALGSWWAEVLGRSLAADDHPGDPEALLAAPDGAGTPLLFVRVPEGKPVKNRLHLDLEPADRTRDEEVGRLRALGAVQVADQRRPDGSGWVVLADPEGNEFCVLRSAAERAGTATG